MNSTGIKKLIQSLSADEAARFLNDMLANDPALMKKAYEVAVKIVDDVWRVKRTVNIRCMWK